VATEKERKLMGEIMNLAVDVTLAGGLYTIAASYIAHIHAFEIRVMKGVSQVNKSAEWAHLSGRHDIWTAKESIERLEQMLTEVKQYHPAFDADGVKL
jgi:hypothetical protein